MIATTVAAALLAAIAGTARFLARGWLAPSVTFPLTWAIVLGFIAIGERYGYLQPTPEAVLVFLVGGLSFVAGAHVAGYLRPGGPPGTPQVPAHDLQWNRLLFACFVIHAVMLPYSWFDIQRATGGSTDVFEIAYKLRVTEVNPDPDLLLNPLVNNYALLGGILIPVLAIGALTGQARARYVYLASAPWIVLMLVGGGRSAVVNVILALLYLTATHGGASLKRLGAIASVLAAVLVAGNLLVGKISATIDDTAGSILSESTRSFFDYLLQGPILFSRYYNSPGLITPTWDALGVPCHLLAKIGWCSPPFLHQEFLEMRSGGIVGNVYSVYLAAYPKYGVLGVIAILGCYGFAAAWLHVRRERSLTYQVLAGYLFAAIVLSEFKDGFGMDAYFFLKAAIVCVAIRKLFGRTAVAPVQAITGST